MPNWTLRIRITNPGLAAATVVALLALLFVTVCL